MDFEIESEGSGYVNGTRREQNLETEINQRSVQEIMWADDEEFEKTVQCLDMRGLLDLVKSLQSCMIEEQLRFDELKLQLEKYSDDGSHNHKKTSAALCTSQMLLAKLCTRNMKCFTQQAVRAKQWMGTRSLITDNERIIDHQTTTTVHKMASTSVQNGCDRSNNAFKEYLQFFQSQVDQVNVPRLSDCGYNCVQMKDNTKDRAENGLQGKANYRSSNSIPSVDNILSSVKNICANQNVNAASRLSTVHTNNNISNEQEDKFHSRIATNVTQISKVSRARHNGGTTRSEQVSMSPKTLTVCDCSKGQSLLSNFNPTYEHVGLCENEESSMSNSITDYRSQLKSTFDTKNVKNEIFDSSKKSITANETDYPIAVVNGSKRLQAVGDTHSQNCNELNSNVKNVHSSGNKTRNADKSSLTSSVITNRTFGQCKEKLLSGDLTSNTAVDENKPKQTEDDSPLNDTADKKDEDNHSEKQAYSFDSDYGSQDFIVHKTSFSDEYLESMSEDANEEYEVEHPEDPPEAPDIPSPDYNSEEEEAEFIESYLNDPRRFVYYSDEKELEVIPEEDEDDIEDSHEEFYAEGIPNQCDSGLTEDQRSSISTAEECDEESSPTIMSKNWDPQELIKVLYRMDFPIECLKKQKTRYINKEGYLEKLPSGRKKATYWNPWKTKYIKLKDGFLYCFDNNHTEKVTMTLQLMGGRIDSLDGKMLGVDDQKGHYVVLRCSSTEDTESWENALHSHCAEDFVNAYTSPCLYPLAISKNVIVIDFGSCSVRAGILMSSPTLPQLFFPTACATNKSSQCNIFGAEALRPNVRQNSRLSFPLHPSAKVTKYSVDVSILPDLLRHVFCELNVRPENFKVQLSMPRNLSIQTKLKIARLLLDDFKVKGVNLTHQAILSLHAYNSKSGIIVDIGDRLDVIPIIEGYIVESGVTKMPYGGQRMVHHLKHALAEKNITVVSDVETYLARYVLEQLCYVAEEYNEELQRFHTNPDDFEMSVSTSHFFKEDCPWDEVILDLGRFHIPEGLFAPETWGLDNQGLHRLVQHAIQECGVDLRREMSRSIYVSGGVTLLPGFVERLENELDKLTPNTITPKVHASPYRYHMSYIGACQIALSDKFDDICLTKQIWKKEGNTCVKKWHI